MKFTPSDEPKLYSRSAVVTDWKCPRKRYLQYELDGRGIVNPHSSLELALGTTVHDGLAGIALGVPIQEAASVQGYAMYQSLVPTVNPTDAEILFGNEQAALVEGLLRGFYRHMWPRLQAAYPEVVMVEKELLYPHDGLLFMAKPDLVARDPEGVLWYVEYKTTSYKHEGWVNQWDTAVQLHSSIRAIEAELGEKVGGVVVQGLYKGYESYGKQSSPFCYAYSRQGNPPFSRTEIRYEYAAGFKRAPTWELDGGVAKWVEDMPEGIIADQFPQAPPIYAKDDLIDTFFNQRATREKEIQLATHMITIYKDNEAAVKGVMDVCFPQKFDQCKPGWKNNKPCEYARICHGSVPNPLESGYEYRVSHHEAERKQNEGVKTRLLK
jgi:hypothetical protein